MKYGSEYAATDTNMLQACFASSIKYMSLIGVGVCASSILTAFFLTDLVSRIIVVAIGLSFLFSGLKDSIAGMLGAAQKTDYLSVLNMSSQPIIFFASLIFVLTGVQSNLIPSIVAVASAGQLLIGAFLLKKYGESPFNFSFSDILKHKTSFATFKKICLFGFFISISMIAFNVMKSLDIIILKLFLDYYEVGIYSVADFYSSILFYMTALAAPLLPAISEADAKKEKRLLEDYVRTALRYSNMIGLPIAITIITLSRPLTVTFYGVAFSTAIAPMRILTVGTFILMLNYNMLSVLIGLGRAKLAGTLMLISALQYLLFLLLLVPPFKFIGAALSLTLTSFSSALLVPYYVKKLTGVNLQKGLWKVGLAILPAIILIPLIPEVNNTLLFVEASLSVGIFLATLYKTGYLSKEDLEMIKKASSSFTILRRKQQSS